jgi:hypothetical protein
MCTQFFHKKGTGMNVLEVQHKISTLKLHGHESHMDKAPHGSPPYRFLVILYIKQNWKPTSI